MKNNIYESQIVDAITKQRRKLIRESHKAVKGSSVGDTVIRNEEVAVLVLCKASDELSPPLFDIDGLQEQFSSLKSDLLDKNQEISDMWNEKQNDYARDNNLEREVL